MFCLFLGFALHYFRFDHLEDKGRPARQNVARRPLLKSVPAQRLARFMTNSMALLPSFVVNSFGRSWPGWAKQIFKISPSTV